MIARYLSFLERRGWVWQGHGPGYVWFARPTITKPGDIVVGIHRLQIYTDGHYVLGVGSGGLDTFTIKP